MIRIMFVCHGNICRSPMAEFLMKDLVKKDGNSKNFLIKSSATSYEEVGNPVHYGIKKLLNSLGIACDGKYAEKLKREDYDKYDYFIGMDERNMRNMLSIFDGDAQRKCKKLLEFAGVNGDVADPYWTGEFSQTFTDIKKGINAFYCFLKSQTVT